MTYFGVLQRILMKLYIVTTLGMMNSPMGVVYPVYENVKTWLILRDKLVKLDSHFTRQKKILIYNTFSVIKRCLQRYI